MIFNRVTQSSLANPVSIAVHALAVITSLGYGIHHLSSGILLIGLTALAAAASSAIALNHVRKHNISPAAYFWFFVFQIIAIAITSYHFGIRGLLMVFPTALAFYFIFTLRLATLLSIVIVALNLYAASFTLETHMLIRYLIAATMSVIFAGCFSWIVESQHSKLEFDANHDYLTQIYNRKGFTEWLTQELSKASSAKLEVALFFIDLDDFKSINDRYGHEVGDKLLVSYVKRLTSILRENEVIKNQGNIVNFARLSGDEFSLSLTDSLTESGAISVVERIIKALNNPFSIGDHSIRLTSSIGIAFASKSNYEIDTLISRADQAMYEAKNKGKNQYCVAK